MELVHKVRPAIVGVMSPSQAALPRRGRYAPGASGVIITPDGLVLSQLHISHRRPEDTDFSVLDRPGERTTVILADGQECVAELLGANRTYDLSLLKLVAGERYPFVPLDPNARVRQGDWVVRLGHPLGFRKDRPAPVRLGRVLGSVPEAFATDCPTMSGDSGGPYFDLEGRLVGLINSLDAGVTAHFLGDESSEVDISTGVYSAVASPRIATLLDSLRRGEMPAARGRPHILSLQGADRLPADEWSQGSRHKAMLKPLMEPLRDSVVLVLNGAVGVARGTGVAADGWVVTRASALPPKPRCRLADGTAVDVEVVGV
ncbi:MAG: serine protease, partial [Chloroflexota bacterium]